MIANDPLIAQLAQCLASAQNAVVLTGAGISTESGIPDFRSPGGIWSQHRTIYFDEFMASADARTEYWRQKSLMHRQFADARPNAGHRVLAQWEQAGRIRGVITQNIDGMHQFAGSQNVLELHGTARQAGCLDCSWQGDIEPFIAQFEQTGEAPPCPSCRGRLKHATISFGQQLPIDILETAFAWASDAPLMVVVGSSLVVTPAADLPRLVSAHGGQLALVNRDPTPLDQVAQWRLGGSIGEVLTAIDAALGR